MRNPTGRDRSLLLWTLLAVVLVGASTRLVAPWRLGILNDEMHHLKSWRNHYGTNDIYPLFISRLERTHQLAGKKLELIKKIYHSSTLAQRGLLVLVDPQPPLFPVSAEVIQAVSHSNLVALRMPSMLASLLSLYLAYRVGTSLRDSWLGAWLALLLAIAHLPQIYAGVGRPYAIAQCAVIGVIYAAILDRRHRDGSPWRFLLCAVVAQATQWMAWLVIAPLVFNLIIERTKAGASLRTLTRQTSWYVLLSLGLLCEMLIQLKNPTIRAMSGVSNWRQTVEFFSVASPFAHLASFGGAGLWAGGILFGLCAVAGAAMVVVDRDSLTALRMPLVAMFLCSIIGMIAAGSQVRFMMTYSVLPIILTGVALRQVFSSPRSSAVAILIFAAGFGGLSWLHPTDAYAYVFVEETPFEPISQRLVLQLKEGDSWAAWPYFAANCLYRAGGLPEPGLPDSTEELASYLQTHRDSGDCYALIWFKADLSLLKPLHFEDAAERWTFRNGFTVFRFPRKSSTTLPSTNQ